MGQNCCVKLNFTFCVNHSNGAFPTTPLGGGGFIPNCMKGRQGACLINAPRPPFPPTIPEK